MDDKELADKIIELYTKYADQNVVAEKLDIECNNPKYISRVENCYSSELLSSHIIRIFAITKKWILLLQKRTFTW